MLGVEEWEEGNDDTEEDEDEDALTAAVAVATAAALALAVAAATASGTAELDCCTIVAGLGVAESSELYPTKASIVACLTTTTGPTRYWRESIKDRNNPYSFIRSNFL